MGWLNILKYRVEMVKYIEMCGMGWPNRLKCGGGNQIHDMKF